MAENNMQIDESNQMGSEVIEPARQMDHLRQTIKQNLSRKIQAMIGSCVNCGQCAESCHYYCSTGESDVIPANKSKTKASGR